MRCDLKTQKLMHGLKCLGVLGRDAQARSPFSTWNGTAKPLHLLRPRRILLMDQRWRRKLSRRKHGCDVPEMRPNGITTCGVLRIVGLGFNGAYRKNA